MFLKKSLIYFFLRKVFLKASHTLLLKALSDTRPNTVRKTTNTINRSLKIHSTNVINLSFIFRRKGAVRKLLLSNWERSTLRISEVNIEECFSFVPGKTDSGLRSIEFFSPFYKEAGIWPLRES